MKYQHGGDIYSNQYRLDFSTNINPFGCNERVFQAAVKGMEQITAYPDCECRRLKEKLSKALGVEASHLFIGNGAAELIFLLVAADKPKSALLITPGFHEYQQALMANGCEILFFDRKEEEQFQLGSDYLERLNQEIERGLDILFLCNPDNPTGNQMDSELLQKILKITKDGNVRMVVDESFYQFVSKEATMIKEIENNPHLFLLRSFTKMYGIPGLRLGYGICSDQELMGQMELSHQPWSVSVPAQEAGIAAIGEEEWCEKTRTYVRDCKELLIQELEALGCKVYPSEANYLLFFLDQELMEPLKERGILIRDCSNYRGLGKGFYRVAVKKKEENAELIAALKEIV